MCDSNAEGSPRLLAFISEKSPATLMLDEGQTTHDVDLGRTKLWLNKTPTATLWSRKLFNTLSCGQSTESNKHDFLLAKSMPKDLELRQKLLHMSKVSLQGSQLKRNLATHHCMHKRSRKHVVFGNSSQRVDLCY